MTNTLFSEKLNILKLKMGELVLNLHFDLLKNTFCAILSKVLLCFWFAGVHFRVGCVMLLLLTLCNGKFYKISVFVL